MKLQEVDTFFSYKHLPPRLQKVSAPFGEFAQAIVALAQAKQHFQEVSGKIRLVDPLSAETSHAKVEAAKIEAANAQEQTQP